MKAQEPFALTALIALIGVSGCVQQTEPINELGLISYAVDGDTIRLSDGEYVRLIGINSTESGEKCFEEAKKHLASLVNNRLASMQSDEENRDKYGRLLRYVFVDDNFVNLELVESGNAFAFRFEPNTLYSSEFALAEEQARAAGKGCLWSKS